jgi:cold shock CspA family protein
MTRGTIITLNLYKGFGFIRPENARPDSRDDNVFFHFSVLEAPGTDPEKGDMVEFDVEHARDGRARAINVRVVRQVEANVSHLQHLEPERDECEPYVQRPGERRQYDTPEPEPWVDRPGDGGRRRRQQYGTRVMRAEEPDRERQPRDFRQSSLRRRAERLFTIPGADEAY